MTGSGSSQPLFSVSSDTASQRVSEAEIGQGTGSVPLNASQHANASVVAAIQQDIGGFNRGKVRSSTLCDAGVRMLSIMGFRMITQIELAKKVGCDRAYINRIMHGKEVAQYSIQKRIARALECDTRDIWSCERCCA